MTLDELSEEVEVESQEETLSMTTQVPVNRELVEAIKAKFGLDTNAEAGKAVDVAVSESLDQDETAEFEAELMDVVESDE